MERQILAYGHNLEVRISKRSPATQLSITRHYLSAKDLANGQAVA